MLGESLHICLNSPNSLSERRSSFQRMYLGCSSFQILLLYHHPKNSKALLYSCDVKEVFFFDTQERFQEEGRASSDWFVLWELLNGGDLLLSICVENNLFFYKLRKSAIAIYYLQGAIILFLLSASLVCRMESSSRLYPGLFLIGTKFHYWFFIFFYLFFFSPL